MVNEVREYYDDCAEKEWQRLANPYSNVEFQTTLHLIEKYFPKEGKIFDIGSGPGRYSTALLEKGYKVTLLDLSKNELEIAKRNITENGLVAEGYYCRSALELNDFQDESLDGILVMGPLYHLHNEEERLSVLKNALRMLKKDGVAIISYINTWGALRASVTEFPEVFMDKEHFSRYIKGDLKFSKEESFTATFFTTPPLALKEVEKAGFDIISYAGSESFLSGIINEVEGLAGSMPEIYNNYVEAACQTCELPQFRDATEHLHIVARRIF